MKKLPARPASRRARARFVVLTLLFLFLALALVWQLRWGPARRLAFEAEDIYGKAYQSQFGAKDLTILYFWASWSAASQEELESLQTLARRYALEGLAVIGVLVDGSLASGEPNEAAIEKAKGAILAAGVSYPILLPGNGALAGKARDIGGLPFSLLIDRFGRSVGTVEGRQSFESWESLVSEKLGL